MAIDAKVFYAFGCTFEAEYDMSRRSTCRNQTGGPMPHVVRLAALFCLAFIPNSAKAQIASDCGFAPFSLRSYPSKLVQLVVRAHTSDPNNAVFGSVLARCDPKNIQNSFVCGVVALRLRTGYIDQARRFFGVYSTDVKSGADFKITAWDALAEERCTKLVIQERK